MITTPLREGTRLAFFELCVAESATYSSDNNRRSGETISPTGAR